MNELSITTEQRINDLHKGIESLLHQGIEKAIEIGQLLSAKKEELNHGEFGTWIKDNLVFTDRTARNYMKLFENKDMVLKAGNISEAYKMLESPKTETVSDLNITFSDDSLEYDAIVKEITERFFDTIGTIQSIGWNAWEWDINIFYKGLNVTFGPSKELESKEDILKIDDEKYPDEKYPDESRKLGRILRLLITRDYRLIKIIEYRDKKFGYHTYMKDAYRRAGLEYDPEKKKISQFDLIPLMVAQASMI